MAGKALIHLTESEAVMTLSMRTIVAVGTVFTLMLLALVFIAGRASNPAGSNYQPSTRSHSYHKTYHHSYRSSYSKGR